MRFQSENTVFKFLRLSVEETMVIHFHVYRMYLTPWNKQGIGQGSREIWLKHSLFNIGCSTQTEDFHMGFPAVQEYVAVKESQTTKIKLSNYLLFFDLLYISSRYVFL